MNQRQSHQPSFGMGGPGGIELNIQELIIRGVAPGDRQQMIVEIEQELSRFLAEGSLHSAYSISASRHPSAARGESVAKQIARNIYQGLSADQ